ncbi:hypothetical protein BST83_15150 [Polaribacter filamentus]|uniref:Uncharacterized protein n=1 Tax=Polaribacter filamentus TaxID=53483 RepID=A0A2S7L0Q2_9FLAO|nr:hypothetical protein [Polaribacter filamentus]PQB08313.1 hypothetical protein BST83_15150 [Polaribacter filamentus]
MFKKHLFVFITLLLVLTNLNANNNNKSFIFSTHFTEALVHSSQDFIQPFYSPYQKEGKKLQFSENINIENTEENEEEVFSQKHPKHKDSISFISQSYSYRDWLYIPKGNRQRFKNYLNKNSLRLHVIFEVFII